MLDIIKNMRKLIIFTILFLSLVGPVSAANLKDAFKDNGPTEIAGGYAGYDKATNASTLDSIVGNLINTVLSLLGVLFLILMLYGGFLWMTAAGDESKITKAKNLITAAVIGTILVVSAYAISVFVIKALQSGTIEGGSSTVIPTE